MAVVLMKKLKSMPGSRGGGGGGRGKRPVPNPSEITKLFLRENRDRPPPWADPGSFIRGGPTLTTFFFLFFFSSMGAGRIQIPTARQRNANLVMPIGDPRGGFFFIPPLHLCWIHKNNVNPDLVCEKELSHMSTNNGNSYLVHEKT